VPYGGVCENMTSKSRNKKAAGREKHRQIERAKKRQRKEKKKVELPTKFKKSKKRKK